MTRACSRSSSTSVRRASAIHPGALARGQEPHADADIRRAMGSFIRLVAVVISGFVLGGFAFFAVDELDRGSKTQQQALGSGSSSEVIPIAPTPADEAACQAAGGESRSPNSA